MTAPGIGLRIRVGRDPSRAFDPVFLIEHRSESGARSFASVTLHPAEPNEAVSDSLFEVPEVACQQLADDLYDLGFRPRGAAGSAGQLDATRAHLEDMQRIARGFLDGKTRLADGETGAKDLSRVAAMAAALGRLAAGDVAGTAGVLEEALRP